MNGIDAIVSWLTSFISLLTQVANAIINSVKVFFKKGFPLSFWDLTLWLAVTAIILLSTSELISSYYGRTNLLINKRRFRKIALTIGLLFLFTVAIRIYEIFITL